MDHHQENDIQERRQSMPIYEYACENCKHTFDALVMSSRDPDPSCPKCRNTRVKKLMSAGNIRGGQSISGISPGRCAPSGG
jgi:putative FmdB family regulatory protein